MPIAAGICKGRKTRDPRAPDRRAFGTYRAVGATMPDAEIRSAHPRSGRAERASLLSPDALASRPRIFFLGRRRLARRPVRTGAPARADIRRSGAGHAAFRRAVHS